MAGLAGVAALARLLSARRTRVDAPALPPAADPAEVLREKLAESRGEPQETQPAGQATGTTLDERRARIHAKAQEAIASMQDDEPPA
jgi:hypothetical protein